MATTVAGWKRNLIKVRELRQKSAGLIWERMTLLIAVFDDPEFRETEGLDDFQAAERLDAELADVCAGFMALRAVMKLYPQKEQWQDRKLHELVAEAMEEERERRKAARSEEPRQVHRVTKAEHQELQQKFEQVAHARERAEMTLAELREENEELRRKLAIAEYRISELESLLKSSRQLV